MSPDDLFGVDLAAIRKRDAQARVVNDIGSPILCAQDRRDLLTEVDRLTAENAALRATVERVRHEGAEQALRDAAKWIRSDPGKTSGGGIAEWLTARIDDIA